MPDLDYGYEVTVQTPTTSDPAATTVTNQWQRQISGNTIWEDIGDGATYKIAAEDRSAKIRLQQDLDGAKVYSNNLQVTSKEFDLSNGVGQNGDFSSLGDYKWRGGVLAPDGLVYGIPSKAQKVVAIDPVTNESYIVGSVGTYGNPRWLGGALASNGKIYAVPQDSASILEITPKGASTTVKERTLSTSLGNNTSMFAGAAVAPNGKIYCIPHSHKDILVLDPVNSGTGNDLLLNSMIPSPVTGSYKWYGGVLAPNGKIIGIPYRTTKVLEIDPANDTATAFGNITTNEINMWQGGVLAPNGKIYGVPYSASSVIEIDPINKTTSFFGSFSPGNSKWGGGVLAPNGKIYCIPHTATTVLEINPVDRTTREFGDFRESSAWHGGVLAPNGKIIGIPYRSSAFLSLDIGLSAASGPVGSEKWTVSGLPGNILDPRSAYFNKF